MNTSYSREFYYANRTETVKNAREIVPYLLKLLRPCSVVDLGCACGTWLAVFREYGVKDVLGVDAYSSDEPLEIPADQFQVRDLGKPIRLARSFDLAVSLEVAEHLPKSAAPVLVESLTQLAPVVLFSAAIPFQGGNHHANEQWPKFWAGLFRQHGYVPIDCLRLRFWDDDSYCWWYAQNMMLYSKPENIPGGLNPAQSIPSLVHPVRYLATADLTAVPFKRLLAALPKAFIAGLKRTLR